MKKIKNCLDTLVFELHIRGFTLEEIWGGLFKASQRTGISLLTFLDHGQSTNYRELLARSVARGKHSSAKCKEWAWTMIKRCIDKMGKFKSSIDLTE